MTDRVALAHTKLSIRSRAGNEPGSERKVVFKSVLENPFRVDWPNVKLDLQRQVLASLLSIVCRVSEYRINIAKKKKKTADVLTNRKRKRLDDENAMVPENADDTIIVAESAEVSKIRTTESRPEPPPILQHMTVGINEVTKRLEQQARESRHKLIVSEKGTVPSSDTRPPIKVIFVCREDVDPPLLIAHIPHLVAACNSRAHDKEPHIVKLIPLPKGAELALADAIGYRRVAVMALDAASPGLSKFAPFHEQFPTVVAKWLIPAAAAAALYPPLIPTHVKQIRTSAPVDMRAAKQRRVQERHIAKQNKKRMAKDKPVAEALA